MAQTTFTPQALKRYLETQRLYAIMKSSVHIGMAHICNQYTTVYGTENEIYAEYRRIRAIQRYSEPEICDIVAMFETLEELHAHPVYQNRFQDEDSMNEYYLDTIIYLPLSNGNVFVLKEDVKND